MTTCRNGRLILVFAGFVALFAGLAPASLPAADGPSIRFPAAYIESRLLGELVVVETEQARPKIEGDRSARVVLGGSGGEPELAARWKPVAPPGHGFNNEPRYELAAYGLQKLFLEECEYVVPPVVLRAMSPEEHRHYRTDGKPTLRDSPAIVFLLSYWLADVSNRDPWDPARFDSDPRYARAWGNLNILTHLIDHKDSNIGNLLISRHPEDPRVFAVDNDVAFRSEASDVGDAWRRLQVDRLPHATIERLRTISLSQLQQALGVLAEFERRDGLLIPVERAGVNLSPRRGVRVAPDRVQFGLTSLEIRDIMNRIGRLLSEVDRGRIVAVDGGPESLGAACR
jgi:hypothetical protein